MIFFMLMYLFYKKSYSEHSITVYILRIYRFDYNFILFFVFNFSYKFYLSYLLLFHSYILVLITFTT